MNKETEEEALVTRCIDEVKSQYVDWYNLGYQTCMAEKKEWVGLTKEELQTIFNYEPNDVKHIVFLVESLCKEKNGG